MNQLMNQLMIGCLAVGASVGFVVGCVFTLYTVNRTRRWTNGIGRSQRAKTTVFGRTTLF